MRLTAPSLFRNRSLEPVSVVARRVAGLASACAAGVLLAALAGCGTAPSSPPLQSDADAQTLAYPGGRLSVRAQNAACQIQIDGEINQGAVRVLVKAHSLATQAGCTRTALHLQSRGGTLGDAVTLGAMVKNRHFDTHIPTDTRCDTPCLLVFAAGQERSMAGPPLGARLAFTQIPPDQDFGQQLCETELSRGQQLTLARYLRAMLPKEAANRVYQRLENARCDRTDTLGAEGAVIEGLAIALR